MPNMDIFETFRLAADREKAAAGSQLFSLNESHHLILSHIESEQERDFYENEAIRQQWTVQQLQRYYDYDLFGRYAISCDKEALMKTVEKNRDAAK